MDLRCCALLRREAVASVGGAGRGFFLYSEETDLFKRLATAGWGSGFEPGDGAPRWLPVRRPRTPPSTFGQSVASAMRASTTADWSPRWRRRRRPRRARARGRLGFVARLELEETLSPLARRSALSDRRGHDMMP